MYQIKNKPSTIDNDLDKNIGDSGDKILVPNVSIKSGDEMNLDSTYKSDKEAKGVSVGSAKLRVGNN